MNYYKSNPTLLHIFSAFNIFSRAIFGVNIYTLFDFPAQEQATHKCPCEKQSAWRCQPQKSKDCLCASLTAVANAAGLLNWNCASAGIIGMRGIRTSLLLIGFFNIIVSVRRCSLASCRIAIRRTAQLRLTFRIIIIGAPISSHRARPGRYGEFKMHSDNSPHPVPQHYPKHCVCDSHAYNFTTAISLRSRTSSASVRWIRRSAFFIILPHSGKFFPD